MEQKTGRTVDVFKDEGDGIVKFCHITYTAHATIGTFCKSRLRRLILQNV